MEGEQQMTFEEREKIRLYNSLVVLYKLSQKEQRDLIDDAIHDLIFGHSIDNDYYITLNEYNKYEAEILELININKEDW